jgi:elongation factor P
LLIGDIKIGRITGMVGVTSLRPGVVFEDKGDIFEVITYNNNHLRRTASVVQLKVRSLRSGTTVDKTFGSNAKINPVSLDKKILQYLYKDTDLCYFMDPKTFEQVSIPVENLSGIEYVKEGENISISFYKNEALSIDLPPKVRLKIKDTNPGVKGNSATNVYKEAVLENGLTTKVPLFIKVGDEIIVDTKKGEYSNRAQ